MFGTLAKRFFGSANERRIRGYQKTVDTINTLEPTYEALSDKELQAQTNHFRQELANGKTLDDLLPEAFATVREASKRTLGLRHYDVQLIGGIVLHNGTIAEMKTGEGKTLVATLAVYLNALPEKGVHVVTVNDYLAQRDAEWMSPIYNFLGLSVDCVIGGLTDETRKAAYAADITYGTNNEFGFDYLRDNMKFALEDRAQRPFHYAIIDEVDSILVDEARTPLIISGAAEDSSELYILLNRLIQKVLPEADNYEVDEKAKSVTFTETGTEHLEEIFHKENLIEEGTSLYDVGSIHLVHHANQALRAHALFQKDTDYIVKDNQIMIIDEFTGRIMEGRRFSEGMHQALEAKENVPIQNENQTLASVTYQNYFRMYPKLAGMTGTAMTEAAEFADIYNLDVIDIPTNVPVTRIDEDDAIYKTVTEKYNAIIDLVEERHKQKQPVLIGTVSIEKSETLSAALKKRKIKHNVLNARHHEREAHIIAQAGQPGAVTVATNMAGRGTDIKLGGNLEMRIEDEIKDGLSETKREAAINKIKQQIEVDKQIVLDAGGLCVIGTERHESRRIDNQLRGRSGRQGDPGYTCFFLSLEDDLMRIFGSERITSVLNKLGFEEGDVINHPWITRALEKAQQKVEGRNYEIRKNLLKFDDVMNDQRKVIYDQRIELMETNDVRDTILDMRDELIEELVNNHMPEKAYAEQWDIEELDKEIFRILGFHLPVHDWAKEEGIANTEMITRITEAANTHYNEKESRYSPEILRLAEKQVLLMTLDQRWKEHLLNLDQLRQGINLRAFGQKDPLNEYKREAFMMFEAMLDDLRERVTARIARMELNVEHQDASYLERIGKPEQHTQEGHIDPAAAQQSPEAPITRKRINPEDRNPTDPTSWGKVTRNEPCPCKSGKKYKHCHGKLA